MKGLLLKDLYELRVYKKNLFLILTMLVALIITRIEESDIISIATLMIMVITSMMSLSTFSYDEKNNTSRYLLTCNLTKKEIVLEKYILSVLSIIVGTLIGSILSIVICQIFDNTLIDYSELISSMSGCLVGLSILHAIEIPCIYKYGAEKGRIQIYIIAMIVVALACLIHFFIPNFDFNISNMDMLENLMPIICIIISIVFYFISYRISLIIYKNKEL